MSNIAAEPTVQVCEGRPDAGPVRELLLARAVPLGESTVVRRLLPTMGRRMVGAWCFVDHYGPDEIAREPGMQVPPHPHTGLQTVSWLLDGEVHHRDSLGSDVLIRPGELGLMTAGGGIAHSEQSPDPHSPMLHGAQLWVALPDSQRERAPSFDHHRELPVLREPGGLAFTLGFVDRVVRPEDKIVAGRNLFQLSRSVPKSLPSGTAREPPDTTMNGAMPSAYNSAARLATPRSCPPNTSRHSAGRTGKPRRR